MFKAKKKIFQIILLIVVHAGLNFSCENRNSSTGNATKEKEGVVKIGVLFSLNGHLSFSETAFKDAVLMAVEEINDDGGVLGKRIEPVVEDPGSEARSYGRLATHLLSNEQVVALFGCQTSEARKAVLPVLRENNSILFYPSPYEGEENSEHVVYLGATPNQQIGPAMSYLLDSSANEYKKFYLIGTDGIYAHKVNSQIKDLLQEEGIPAENVAEKYISAGQEDFEEVVREIKYFCARGKVVIINTVEGNSNVAFFKEFANQGLSSAICPVMSFLVSEEEFRHMETEFVTGHLSARNYFQTVDSDKNIRFVSSYKLYNAIKELPGGIDRVTTDGVAWAYTAVYLWKKAVEKARSFDPEKVKKALYGIEYNSPAGVVRVGTSHLNLMKPVFIAESQADGLFEVVWESDSLVEPVIYSDSLLRLSDKNRMVNVKEK